MSKEYKVRIQMLSSLYRARNGYIFCKEYSYNIILKSYKYVMRSIKNGNSVVRHPIYALAGTGIYTFNGHSKYPRWVFTYYNNPYSTENNYNTEQLEKLWAGFARFAINTEGEYNAHKLAKELHAMLKDCNVYLRKGFQLDTFDVINNIFLIEIIKDIVDEYNVDLSGIV